MAIFNFSAKWFIATFATYFVLRKKIKPWWAKVSKSPIFIFLLILAILSCVHTFVLRPYQKARIGSRLVPPAPLGSAPPPSVPVANANEQDGGNGWIKQLGKIRSGISGIAMGRKEPSNEREPFADFAPIDGKGKPRDLPLMTGKLLSGNSTLL
ncbi:hypothetical protein BC830DRAFT_1088725 [Chytriomyces sp. MP71]|nr:hypothetical protein BC830DRAFT_1088725 [Chytriomyces sp. MP71]